jgi:hypothetical protein
MRFNNIGVKPLETLETLETPKVNSSSLLTKGTKALAIVKYHPNRYYGMLNTYLSSGWVDLGDYILHNKVKINKNCFDHIESNYVLAFVYLYEGEEQTNLESVGDRILYIEEEEKKDFFDAYKEADKILLNSLD